MWFVWGLITFVVFAFSTTQLVCVAILTTKFRDKYTKLVPIAKKRYMGSFFLHLLISGGWLVIAFAVSGIRQHIWAVLLAEAIGVIITIFRYPNMKAEVESQLEIYPMDSKYQKNAADKQDINIDSIYTSIAKMQNVVNNPSAVETFSKSELVSSIVNLMDAHQNLPPKEYEMVVIIYEKYENDFAKISCDRAKYFELCFEILSNFDLVAQIEKYSGDSAYDDALANLQNTAKFSYRQQAHRLMESGQFDTDTWHKLQTEFKQKFWNIKDI